MTTINNNNNNFSNKREIGQKERGPDDVVAAKESGTEPFQRSSLMAHSPQPTNQVAFRFDSLTADPSGAPTESNGETAMMPADSADTAPGAGQEEEEGQGDSNIAVASMIPEVGENSVLKEVIGSFTELLLVVHDSKPTYKVRQEKVKEKTRALGEALGEMNRRVDKRLLDLERQLKDTQAVLSKIVREQQRLPAKPQQTGSTPKRPRDSPGDERPGGSKKSANRTAARTPAGNPQAGASYAEVLGTTDWQTVKGRGKTGEANAPSEPVANRKKRVRDKGEAILVRTGSDSVYEETLGRLRSDPRLNDLGADVRTVRRTREGDLILELRRNATKRSEEHKAAAKEVLGEDAEVRALSQGVTLRVRDIDAISKAEDLRVALEEQCQIKGDGISIRMLKGPPRSGTQVALVQLPAGSANAALRIGKVKVGWSVCPLTIHKQPETCFRCMGFGHRSFDCKGEDRRGICRRCGGKGHIAAACKEPARCLICPEDADKNHVTGSTRCPVYRKAMERMSPA